MPAETEIYLDIETDWARGVTVIGFNSSLTGLVQLVGTEISKHRLLKELPRTGVLFTYNGHCFDIPVLRSALGVNLREVFDSHDLRWICQRRGIRGGQKAIEQRIGHRRELDGLNGIDAMTLWSEFQRGNRTALDTLLAYNAEDLTGLAAIKAFVDTQGFL